MVKYAAKHKNYPKSFVNCEKVFNFASERWPKREVSPCKGHDNLLSKLKFKTKFY